MKINKTIVSIMLLLTGFVFSCDKDSEGVSRITFYPIITLNGEEEVYVLAGDPYTEDGGVATEEGTEIDLAVSYSGTYFTGTVSTINTNVADLYTGTYSATNKDGFSGSQSRTIIVAGQGDLVTSIEGLYTSTVMRNGVSGAQYTNMPYVFISKTGANTYQLSDGIGGYYDLGRGYGATYAALGATLTANDIASDNFSFGPAVPVGAFGGEATITSMQVDAATKTIHLVSEWDGGPYTFDITLKQVAL